MKLNRSFSDPKMYRFQIVTGYPGRDAKTSRFFFRPFTDTGGHVALFNVPKKNGHKQYCLETMLYPMREYSGKRRKLQGLNCAESVTSILPVSLERQKVIGPGSFPRFWRPSFYGRGPKQRGVLKHNGSRFSRKNFCAGPGSVSYTQVQTFSEMAGKIRLNLTEENRVCSAVTSWAWQKQIP